jgi:hypothetical protein
MHATGVHTCDCVPYTGATIKTQNNVARIAVQLPAPKTIFQVYFRGSWGAGNAQVRGRVHTPCPRQQAHALCCSKQPPSTLVSLNITQSPTVPQVRLISSDNKTTIVAQPTSAVNWVDQVVRGTW